MQQAELAVFNAMLDEENERNMYSQKRMQAGCVPVWCACLHGFWLYSNVPFSSTKIAFTTVTSGAEMQ